MAKQDLTIEEINARLKLFQLPDFDVLIGIGTGGVEPVKLVAEKCQCVYGILNLNYRDENNQPRYDEPQFLEKSFEGFENKTILLVDDVSVSGKTLEVAKRLLNKNNVITFTFKGKADFVLFPEIKTCVNWPWKK